MTVGTYATVYNYITDSNIKPLLVLCMHLISGVFVIHSINRPASTDLLKKAPHIHLWYNHSEVNGILSRKMFHLKLDTLR